MVLKVLSRTHLRSIEDAESEESLYKQNAIWIGVLLVYYWVYYWVLVSLVVSQITGILPPIMQGDIRHSWAIALKPKRCQVSLCTKNPLEKSMSAGKVTRIIKRYLIYH
jgi:hypothetical protein